VRAALQEKKKSKLTEEEKSQLREIEQMLHRIEIDGSYGIHNFSTIEELLTNFGKTLKN